MNDGNEQTGQAQKKVVIVDDEEFVRKILGEMLSYRGDCQVFYAKNGEEGVRVIKEVDPDLVITDLLMPVQDGIYVASETKAYDPYIPIIVVTGNAQDDPMVEQAVEAGASAVLQKPVSIKDLGETVDRMFAQDCVILGREEIPYHPIADGVEQR